MRGDACVVVRASPRVVIAACRKVISVTCTSRFQAVSADLQLQVQQLCDCGPFNCCRHHVPKLEELALANCGTVEKRDVLRQHLAALDAAELSTLVCRQLRCGPPCGLRILC